MTSPVIDELAAGWTLDGAVGTELVARGADPSDPERWVSEQPEAVRALHEEMLAAGAVAVTSATFASPRLGAAGADRVRAAVALAKAAGAPRVLASLGPGSRHVMLAEVAVEAGADAVVLETFVLDDELRATTAAVADRLGGAVPLIAGYCPLQASVTARVAALPERLRRAGATALMVGCGDGAGSVAAVAEALVAGPLPIIARPSPGLPGALRSPRALAGIANHLQGAGVIAMGACCGGGVEYVRAIAEAAR